MSEMITLGNIEVEVLAQRHAYLTRQLGPAVQAVVARGEVNADSIIEFAGEAVYDLLSALIPTLERRMPRWQFLGFASLAAMEAGEYDQAEDSSPTVLEIKQAFVVGLRVNGIDELVKLGKVIDPALLRVTINEAVANSVRASMDSAKSLSTTGMSESTSSGMTAQASTANGGSRSPASVA